MNNADTATKVANRIANEARQGEPIREAAKRAAWSAVQEAKGLGWSDQTIGKMVRTFVEVAVEMQEVTA